MASQERLSPRCGIVGTPVDHSLSPALHRTAYRYLGLDWTFTRHEVELGDLADFLAPLGPQWAGLAVTMPLKGEALRLAAEHAPLAEATGAANTLLHRPDGSWAADNTDVSGIRAALDAARGDARPVGAPAAVLGAGATARSAVAALAGLAPVVHVYARRPSRSEALRQAAQSAGTSLEVRAWEQRHEAWDAPLLVATTPPGVLDADADALPGAVAGTLLDVGYATWPTPLATAWTARGGRVAGGLDLLVEQARVQLRLMTGADVPVEVLRGAADAARAAPPVP